LPQKLWDLESKSLLATFQFPHAVTCIAWDAAERLFFAASGDGSIHQINLYRTRIDKTHGRVAEAIGGAGVSDALSGAENERDSSNRRLVTVGCVNPSLRYRTATHNPTLSDLLFREPITALCLSLTGAMLLAGTALGNVHVYDVPSHQLLRTINAHPGPGLAVTHLTTLLKPPDLVGHVRLDGDKDGKIPVRPIVPFQRMREARPREAHEVTMMLPHAQKVCSRLLGSYKRNMPSSAVFSYCYDRPRRTIPSRRIRARSFSAIGNSSSSLLPDLDMDMDMLLLGVTRTVMLRLQRRDWMDARRNLRMRSRG
jgi:pre-rRNA-processing protein IPI3